MNKTNRKNIVRLTESELHRIIKECLNKAIKETLSEAYGYNRQIAAYNKASDIDDGECYGTPYGLTSMRDIEDEHYQNFFDYLDDNPDVIPDDGYDYPNTDNDHYRKVSRREHNAKEKLDPLVVKQLKKYGTFNNKTFRNHKQARF